MADEFASYDVKGVMPQFAEERLIQALGDLPPNSDLSVVSKWIISAANRQWETKRQRVAYGEYREFEKAYTANKKIKREICAVGNRELNEILALCGQHKFSVNDYLIAKMMLEDNTNKVVVAADIRKQIKCYRQGAMGNYATAFSVVVKKKEENIISLAQNMASEVLNICRRPREKMLVIACYLCMRPELIDAVAISTLGNFGSRAGAFIGKNLFGDGSQNGYSITNLGKMQSDVIRSAIFIPPARPQIKKRWAF